MSSAEGCVLCGRHRLPGSSYCQRCIRDACEHCGNVHDRNPCDPPTERNTTMTTASRAYFSEDRLLVEAGDLLSDHGDDPVHDEAIVTLVARLLGRDDHAAVSTLIIQTYSRHVETEFG